MESTLTYQFRQQQLENKQVGLSATNLPSPPDSSYGGEDSSTFTNSCVPPFSLPNQLRRPTDGNQDQPPKDSSLQSHFSTLTLQAITNSLPENYTIDHSSIQASLQRALVVAATKTHTPPIPIGSTTENTTTHLSTTMPVHHRLSPQSPRQQPNKEQQQQQQLQQYYNNSLPTSSASLPSSGYHRCDDCGKVYKHPSCLTKHRWEHSEEWELTSKLPLTKHQQVQMLEAAAILVSMDQHKQQLQQQQQQQQQSSSVDQQVEDDDEVVVDIVNDDDDVDDDDDQDSYVNIDDDDDDDILMDLDDEEPMDQAHTFPSMIGSTPAMLPSSFSAHVI
ncbi:hypothetical protein BC941DRAFT_202082 [Chlamydoabsidia padenii]|nr:hypothetical protein BC941DRAFT_202082 [Chlamydoabsidia padenii]